MKLIEFDTRDTKPKLYGLLALSVVTALIIGVLFWGRKSAGAVCVTVAVYCFSAVVMLLYAFREQLRYNPYSYNTILYFGFALFVFFVMNTYAGLAVRIFKDPEHYFLGEILHTLLNSAKNYILLSFPFLFVFSIALCVSNISLIRHEGRRVVNLLGILLSVLILAGEAFIFVFDFSASGSQTEVMIHDLVTNIFAAVYLYFQCMLIGTMVAAAITARYEPKKDKDFIIILGCGLKKDGMPTPLLQGRIDRALSFYNKQKEETGKGPVFVTSGGQGPDEVISESGAMKRYLIAHGVPEEQILEEDRSADTFENMKFSKAKITEKNEAAKIAFSTTNYHVFRSGIFARRVKMRAVGMGARTKWYFWPNAAVREFIGLLTKHRVKQVLVLGMMIVVYVSVTLLAYSI